MTSRTYAIADLHGRYDLLERALWSIKAHAKGVKHKIITLGDYIDRGPQSKGIIETLMEAQARGLPFICLKGNHEDMMVQTLRKPLDHNWWIANGGGTTLMSYGHVRYGDYDPTVVPEAHIDWMDQLPLYHVDAHRVFVHAYVKQGVPLEQQGTELLLWSRYPVGAEDGYRDLHVVHGHDWFEDGPKIFKGRTNLDTRAYHTGRLVVGVFDDDQPGGPIGAIEIKGDPR
ncbi:metallophosphoesterase family protein [Bradyrhizobium sp. 2S1]|uniref:metallophosphoesterase family protein n=1 Tax=Bradyrhizobium sp. 2S1 TaxID=1404429 RepID=UPI00140C359C|nr:metallophosphoesterase family protein [Bradyrhizobium sp. 2S1]MCK7669117.1 serine/threonine protein phosphatase [Bradyrhizobium sp. 2S1]